MSDRDAAILDALPDRERPRLTDVTSAPLVRHCQARLNCAPHIVGLSEARSPELAGQSQLLPCCPSAIGDRGERVQCGFDCFQLLVIDDREQRHDRHARAFELSL